MFLRAYNNKDQKEEHVGMFKHNKDARYINFNTLKDFLIFFPSRAVKILNQFLKNNEIFLPLSLPQGYNDKIF